MKSKNLFASAILLALPFCLLAQITLNGIVKEKEGGTTLSGATVRMENTFLTTTTNGEGKFIFKNLNHGNYRIIISFIGFESISQEIKLESDTENEFSLERKIVRTDEVVVYATRATSNTPATFTNLNYAEIEKQNLGQDVPYLLNMTPSVVVSSDAGAGVGYTGIRIRGSDPTRVNVTINGIPVNDAESQGTYWVDMPDLISSTDNIQIQRGVGTSTNGAGAFGGSVNIKTTGLNEKAYGEISNSYGSFNTMKNTLKLGTGLIDGKFAFDGRLSQVSSDGYIDRANSKMKSFYVSGGYFGKKTVLKAIAFSGVEKTYQAWYGVPQDSLETNRTFNPAGMYFDANGDLKYYKNETDNYQQDYYQLHFSQQLNTNWNFNAALHYTYGRGYYEQFIQGQTLTDYGIQGPVVGFIQILQSDLICQLWLDNDFYGTTYSLNYSDNKKLNLIFGGAANNYVGRHFGKVVWAQFAGNSFLGDKYYNDKAEKSDVNFFGKMNYRFTSKLSGYGDLQYRMVNYTFTGFDEKLASAEQTAQLGFFNPKAGLSYDLSSNKNLYVQFGIGNKEPSRDDYVQSSPASRPKSEQLQNLELGYRQKNKITEFGINYYMMNYKNQLVLTGEINDVGAYNRTNIDKSYRTGVELEWGIKPTDKIEWNANVTYSMNKVKNFKEYIDDYDNGGQIINTYGETDISFSPALIAASKLAFKPVKNFTASILSKYVSEQFLDNTSDSKRQLNPFFVNDMLFSYSIKTKAIKEISFTFMINNVLDEMYSSNGYTYSYFSSGSLATENYYYPQAGRNYMGGITLKF